MQLHELKPFVERITAENLNLFGIYYYKDNDLVEYYRWTPDVPMDIMSHTKCYVSAAIGAAVEDGLLRLSDHVVDVLADVLPDRYDPKIEEITLEHLLTMSSGFHDGILFDSMHDSLDEQYHRLTAYRKDGMRDLAAYVLSHAVKKQPGTAFTYSNGDAYLAGRMLEKASGMSMDAYVYYRLLEPMGLPHVEWKKDLGGHCMGSAGMKMRTDDMAALGKLFLAGGVWNGERLLSKTWIEASSSLWIETPQNPEKPDIWRSGYGYLIWQLPYDAAYRFSGMFGQNSLMFPKEGIQFAFQAHVAELNRLKKIVNEELIERIVYC